jgi:hypothetical protein
VQNWGVYDMYNATDANLVAAQDFARSYFNKTELKSSPHSEDKTWLFFRRSTYKLQEFSPELNS